MPTPESGPREWTNLSAQKCKAVWDVLAKIEKHAGIPLPGGKTTNELLSSKGGDLLDYAESVSADQGLWQQIPEEFTVRGIPFTKEQIKTDLGNLIEECR